jgi:hypothetical protein
MGRVSRVLDWSKPLKDQPAFVVAAVRAALKPRKAYQSDGEVGGDSGLGGNAEAGDRGSDAGTGASESSSGDNTGGPSDAGAGTDTYSNTTLAHLPGFSAPATTPTTPDWIGPKPSDPLNTAWKKIGTGTPSVGKTFTLAELPELNRGGAVARALRVVRRSSK